MKYYGRLKRQRNTEITMVKVWDIYKIGDSLLCFYTTIETGNF